MKVSIQVARQEIKRLANAGAKFEWNETTLHGSWLSFEIKSVYCDRVETILDSISNNWVYEIDKKQSLARFDMYDFTKENTVEKKTIFKIKQWLTRQPTNPVPMRTMEGVVIRETNKAYQVRLNGMLKPSSQCNHCGRKLTHPVSLLYGLGPICGNHFHINPCTSKAELERRYDEMATIMQGVTWEGWIPKSQIERMEVIG